MAITPYLIAYLSCGFLLACGFSINHRTKLKHQWLAFFVITILWPLFALLVPDTFFKTEKDTLHLKKTDHLSSQLRLQLENQPNLLAPSLTEKITSTAKNGEKSIAYFGSYDNFSEILFAFWDEKIPPSIYYELRSARSELEEHEPYSGPQRSIPEPDWYIGFSKDFLKCISNADGKMRGRILDAIGKVSIAPLDIVGDTIKPLTRTYLKIA